MRRTVGLLAAVLVIGACAGDDGTAENAEPGGGEAGLRIVEPGDSAAVEVPFTVRLDVDVPLGQPESGDQHVHLFFDGDMSEFEIVDADTWQVTAGSPALAGVEPGETTLNVSLHNADHTPAGPVDEISVTLLGGAGQDEGNGPAYDY